MDFEKFKKFLKENVGDMTNAKAEEGKKALVKAARAGLEQLKEEVPGEAIERFVQNTYALLDNPKIAKQISEAARSVNGEKIGEVLEQFTAGFTTEEQSLQLARMLKQLDQAGQLDTLVDSLENNVDKMGGPQKFATKLLMKGLEPVLKNVSSLDEEQLAQEIRESFSDLPTNDAADMVEALARNVSPEAISAITHQATGKLPAPKTLAEIFEGVLDAGIKHVERKLSNDPNAQQGDLASDVRGAVEKALKKDAQNKNNFGGGPGRKGA
ncbi:MAG: hypothetical protein EA357_08645 [Micavibrio sp.]|jgi:truncated hemoglobin YjbI|nr:MAG: hypothetical protein EA357_08645 [Micavibrio sp.]